MLLGVHEAAHPDVTGRTFVGHEATREFMAGVVSPRSLIEHIKRDLAATWMAGQTGFWSFKPNPDDVASGAWRGPVQDLAMWAANNPDKPFVLVIWHEPENDFDTPEAFVDLFNDVHDWVKAINPDLLTCHAALTYRYVDKFITEKDAPRWKTKADLNCADTYSGRTYPLDKILPDLPNFMRWFKHVAGKRWGLTERGWTITPRKQDPEGIDRSAVRADSIQREFAWLAMQPTPPEVYLVWATVGTEKDQGLLLDARAKAAVAAGFLLLAKAQDGKPPTAATPVVFPAAGTVTGPDKAPAALVASGRFTCPNCHGSFVIHA